MNEKSNTYSKRTQQISYFSKITNYLIKYEAEISGSIVLSVLLNYFLGSPLASDFMFVSYKEAPDQYSKGVADIYFVVFWSVMFTFLRAIFIKYLYIPLSNYFNIGKPSKRQRVAEQSYILAYYVIFGTAGMLIMYNSPHWFNTSQYWIDYPHVLISKHMKKYYLMQLAFWFQQLYSLHTEKRRKDHLAMLSHHIITITLVASSYYCNATRVGNAVLCCMDLADIFLSLAKILKYLGFTNVCNVAFGLFAVSWPITRHFFFSIIIWSVAFEPQKYIDLKWDPSEGKFLCSWSLKIFLGLLIFLNVIMFYWFLMIVNVIIRLIKGTITEDPRSDDENESSSNDSDDFRRNPNACMNKEKKSLLKM